MSETPSIRIDFENKKRLDELQLGEIRDGIAELDSGQSVSHEKVSKWLETWGEPGETEALR